MTTPTTVLEKDGISALGMVGEILAYLEQEAKREAEEEAAAAAAAKNENQFSEDFYGEVEEAEKIVWTLEGILDHVSALHMVVGGDLLLPRLRSLA